jgi:hypothetical protein
MSGPPGAPARSRWIASVGDSLRRDSCGCATGAVFLGLALAVTSAWHGWHWRTSRLSPGATAARIVCLSIGAAIVGKLVGLLLHRKRTRGLRARV